MEIKVSQKHLKTRKWRKSIKQKASTSKTINKIHKTTSKTDYKQPKFN